MIIFVYKKKELIKRRTHFFIFNNFVYFFFLFSELNSPIMKGWFDAFRDDGGPTLYSFSNRTPVTGDVSTVAVCVLFGTLYAAFLVIFPGVRKQVFDNLFIYMFLS